MPRCGGACPAARSGARAPGIAGATRPRRLCLRSRHRCGCLGTDGAPLRPGDGAVSFAGPLLLVALLALPFWWWLRARRLSRLRGTRMSDVRPSAGAGERLWVARLPVTLRSLCLGAWIFAAAGPRVGSARAQSKSEGISIVLAIDLSSSMLSEDFAPANRIDVAKQTAIEFVRERRSDRIGLVAFAAQALTQVPITTDYAVLEQALRDLRIGMLEDGTAIGTGIATAANRLRRAPGKSRVIVLLTDGVNNRGTVDPRTAALAAAAFGIKIYVIGVRTRAALGRRGLVRGRLGAPGPGASRRLVVPGDGAGGARGRTARTHRTLHLRLPGRRRARRAPLGRGEHRRGDTRPLARARDRHLALDAR